MLTIPIWTSDTLGSKSFNSEEEQILETDVQTVTLVQEPITAEWTWTRNARNTFIFLNLASLGSIVEPVVRL